MDRLKIIIGDDLPDDVPNIFNEIDFYIKDVDDLTLYANVTLPYLINHVEAFLEIEDDPRYIFYEGYEEENGNSQYICVVKPLGELRGIYRLGLGTPFKVRNVEAIKTRSLK